jgi:hypothetical protein
MRFKQIIENSTTTGSVASVTKPMMTQTRENTNVRGLKPVEQVMKGAKKKGPYANSITEGKVKQLSMDLTELTDEEFKKKYGKTKAEIRDSMKKVNEDDLSEQDLIVIPGQGRIKRTGFVKHDLDQGEHEGHTLKNSLHTIARAASDLDKRLSVQSEFPEWVSEKIGAAKGMMVSVMDYLISSQEMQHEDVVENYPKHQDLSGISTDKLKEYIRYAARASNGLKSYLATQGEGNQVKRVRAELERRMKGVAEGSAADGSVNYTLGHTPDAEYVYSIYRDGQKEGTYHSVDQAREIMGNMKLTSPNREYKIKRGARNKMAGPASQLPEQGMAEGSRTPQDWEVKSAVWRQDKQGVYLEPQDVKSHFVRADRSSRAEEKAKREYEPGRGTWEIHPRGNKQQGVAEDEKDTSRMNKQHQDFYNKNPNFKRDDRETTSVGGRLATKVTPKTAQVTKKPMTPFEGKIDFAKKIEKNVDKHNKAVVQTKKDIGSRVADIGPGGKEYNVKTDAAWDAAKKKVSEGAKVDRMVKHVKQSEKKLGHSSKEAENIAWATANKRGMLDNKNKK